MYTTKNIPISIPSKQYESKEEVTSYLKRNSRSFDCKMDKNAFDPTKFSPPNPWLQKLENRIQQYYQINK
jgi:hypothetical protein|tara:strand:+ start:264 stop:473 length:210 start_codon:yes stop_codon:yes gene_type:complete